MTRAASTPHFQRKFGRTFPAQFWGIPLNGATRARTHDQKGLRDRNSPTCTLSQNGYGGICTQPARTLKNTAMAVERNSKAT